MEDAKYPKNSYEHLSDQISSILPILEIVGIFNPKYRQQVKKVKNDFSNMKTIMFNIEIFKEKYGQCGWTIYDEISTDIVQQCVDTTLDKGETVLIEYFLNEDNLSRLSYRFHKSCFCVWKQLVNTSFDRIKEGDFISAIPLLIIVIDGMSLKYAHGHAFSGNIDKAIFDCLASSGGAIEQTLKIFGKTKRQVEDNSIEMPFRHGIMHGVTPNYGNAFVTAKTVNLLWALVNYFERSFDEAKSIENAKKEQTIPKWSELISKIVETDRKRKLIDEWIKRDKVSNVIICNSSGENNTIVGSPEEFVANYLNAMVMKNYGYLATRTAEYAQRPVGYRAGKIRNEIGDITVCGWVITGYTDAAPAITEVDVELKVKYDGKHKTISNKVRCLYADDDSNALTRNDIGGSWFAMPMFIYDIKALFFKGG